MVRCSQLKLLHKAGNLSDISLLELLSNLGAPVMRNQLSQALMTVLLPAFN